MLYARVLLFWTAFLGQVAHCPSFASYVLARWFKLIFKRTSTWPATFTLQAVCTVKKLFVLVYLWQANEQFRITLHYCCEAQVAMCVLSSCNRSKGEVLYWSWSFCFACAQWRSKINHLLEYLSRNVRNTSTPSTVVLLCFEGFLKY